jgi:hyperosmotically inducible protein
MGFLFRLLLLVVLLVGLFWLFREPVMDRLGQRARAEAGHAERGIRNATDDLDTDRIAAELKQTGRVVRRKAAVALKKLDEGTRDARTTAKIKARLALDPDLSAREIHVSTTDGHVTLAGRVNTPEDVARAIRLALEEDEVVEVDSTLQVRAAAERDQPRAPSAREDVPPASIPSPAPTATPLP